MSNSTSPNQKRRLKPRWLLVAGVKAPPVDHTGVRLVGRREGIEPREILGSEDTVVDADRMIDEVGGHASCGRCRTALASSQRGARHQSKTSITPSAYDTPQTTVFLVREDWLFISRAILAARA